MQLESQRLAYAKNELEKMGFDHRKDIDMLRAKIEVNSRDLSYANGHLRQKIKEHQEAAMEVERLSNDKEMLTAHLRVIISDNEKKKKKKLAELMSSLDGAKGTKGTKAPTPSSTSAASPKASPPAPQRTSSWTGF